MDKLMKAASLNTTKVFNVGDLNSLNSRSGSPGFQRKYISSDKKYFIKQQSIIDGKEMFDYLVELYASMIAQQFPEIDIMKYERCIIVCNNKNVNGCYADNYEIKGYSYLSLRYLCTINNIDYDAISYSFEDSNAFDELVKLFSDVTLLSENVISKYIKDLIFMDLLTCNIDRHGNNLGVFIIQGAEIPAKIFDFGAGYWQGTADLHSGLSINALLRRASIGPLYSYYEDAVYLLRDKCSAKEWDRYKSFVYPELPKELKHEAVLEYQRNVRRLFDGIRL